MRSGWRLTKHSVYFFRLSFTKGHFPKLAECAHFHYENVDFGTLQVKFHSQQNQFWSNYSKVGLIINGFNIAIQWIQVAVLGEVITSTTMCLWAASHFSFIFVSHCVPGPFFITHGFLWKVGSLTFDIRVIYRDWSIYRECQECPLGLAIVTMTPPYRNLPVCAWRAKQFKIPVCTLPYGISRGQQCATYSIRQRCMKVIIFWWRDC